MFVSSISAIVEIGVLQSITSFTVVIFAFDSIVRFRGSVMRSLPMILVRNGLIYEQKWNG